MKKAVKEAVKGVILNIHSEMLPHLKHEELNRKGNEGIPQILSLEEGGKIGKTYSGERTEEALLHFLKDVLGPSGMKVEGDSPGRR